MELNTKFRPKSFAEVIGQEVVVSVLSRQIATKTFKHCYLFCGPSGSGKTTIARIFSSEINNGIGNPIEIDAASNNGVDSIRAISQNAQQASLDCNYKVFVIDECHQLTKAAWDAALKLIEEPPETAIFIFCTTNPSKIPETIMSRLQRFDFRKVGIETIYNRLEFICNEELKIDYDKNALKRIASISNGNVREAIKLLDTLISSNNDITVENINKLLGKAPLESVIMFCKFIYIKDHSDTVKEAIYKELNKLINSTSNYVDLYDDILSIAIDFEIYSNTGNKYIVSIPEEHLMKFMCSHELVERLSKYRQYVDNSNAIIYLKIIVSEMLYGT